MATDSAGLKEPDEGCGTADPLLRAHDMESSPLRQFYLVMLVDPVCPPASGCADSVGSEFPSLQIGCTVCLAAVLGDRGYFMERMGIIASGNGRI